jgi:CheY-like chemotaxis protein
VRTPEPAGRVFDILLVEDNPADVRLIREGLQGLRSRTRLHVASDGVQAMDFLRRGSPRPDLVLLDLNLPRRDGREVLGEVKQDDDLCELPVVVFTTSRAPEDVARCYRLHANAYVVKPVRLRDFVAVMAALESFWLGVAALPSVQGRA